MGGAGLRNCLFSAIMVGKTRPYDGANHTINAGRVYEIVCFRQLWLVKPAPTIAQIIQLTMPNA